jgi:CRP-like cAMP-binding protein
VQFGVPPETIKDSMLRPHGVPNLYVLTRDFFSYARGVSYAEMEFPIYFNFFVAKKKVRVVGTAEQRDRLGRFMRESMFGPPAVDLAHEISGDRGTNAWWPDLDREVAYFRRHPFEPGRPMQLEDVMEFHLLDGRTSAAEVGGLRIERHPDGSFLLSDPAWRTTPLEVPGGLLLPPREPEPHRRSVLFTPPVFGVTILGSGHGFDPKGKTTGFILWVNGRGLLVDPPVDTTEWLREREVPSRCIDGIILTHVHGDHDAGTLQKALLADRIHLYTTPTIFESFLRKSEAITGLSRDRFPAVLEFVPVPIRRPVNINGARFVFNYSLHSIPTIRFECWAGGKSLVYTADTLNDPDRIRALADEGVLAPGRARDLLDFPWQHDLVIHEAGVPPLHTPVSVLAKLPEDVKRRLYLVHTTAGHIPAGTGLRLAPEGLEGTITLDASPSPRGAAVSWLMAMRSVEHFRDMPVGKAVEFLERCEIMTFAPGEAVIKKGDPGRHFFMILEGKAAIRQGEVSEKVFGMYDYFGEASLVMDVPRTADVVALTRLTVLAMEKDDFLAFIRGTSVETRMARLFMNRGHNTWALLDRHPILRSLNAAQRNELQTFMVLIRAHAGEALVEAGAAQAPAFLVASGAIEETRGAFDVVRHGPGSLAISVDALVDGRPAPVALRAAEESQAFVLPVEPFARFLRSYPGLYLRLLHGQ